MPADPPQRPAPKLPIGPALQKVLDGKKLKAQHRAEMVRKAREEQAAAEQPNEEPTENP